MIKKWIAKVSPLLKIAALVVLITIVDFSTNRIHFVIPSAFLHLPTGWIFLSLISYCAFACSLYVFLGRCFKILFAGWLMWSVLYLVLAFYLWHVFGMQLCGELLLTVQATNSKEVGDFLSDLSIAGVAGFVIGIVSIWMGMRMIRSLPVLRLTRQRAILGLSGILLFAGCNFLILPMQNSMAQLGYLYWPGLAAWQYHNFSKVREAVLHPRLPDCLEHEDGSERILGVLVIGESATRNHWGCYGYGRNTTPFLSSMTNGELFVFKDVVGVSAGTVGALRWLLTDAEVVNDQVTATLPSVLRRAGLQVSYVSNNAYDSERGPLGMLFHDCSEKMVLPVASGQGDFSLLPVFCNSLQKERVAMLLNGQGSHHPFENAYPPAYEVFEQNYNDSITSNRSETITRSINSYDNSVVATDALLNAVINELKRSGRLAFLVYVSDHGETPAASNWRVWSDLDLWELPMVVWLSDEYTRRFPDMSARLSDAINRPLQTDQLFWGLISLWQIVGVPNYSPERDFTRAEFRGRKVRRIQYGKVVYEKR